MADATRPLLLALLGLAVPLVLQGVQLWHQRATGQDPDAEEAEGTGTQSADGAAETEPQA